MSDAPRTTEQRQRRALIDDAISRSRSKPELVGHLEKHPEVADIAESLEGKALLASRSPWGTLFAGIVGLIIARYGLHLDDASVSLISGFCVLIGSYIMRTLTRAPITGIVRPGAL